MHQLHQLFSEIHYIAVGKSHIVPLLFTGGHMGHVKLTLIDKILRTKSIAVCLFKFLQSQRAYGKIIRTPVRIEVPVFLFASPYPDKVVKQGGKTHYRSVRVGFAPVFQPLVKVVPGLFFSGVYGYQMLLVPVIGHVIVHGNFFPDTVRQKAYRIIMEGNRLLNYHVARFLFKTPLSIRELFFRCSVINLPVTQGFLAVVDDELTVKKAVHQMNRYHLVVCRYRGGHQKGLL